MTESAISSVRHTPIPACTKSKKTKNSGYLKDGFVVDDDSNENSETNDEYNSSDEIDDDNDKLT